MTTPAKPYHKKRHPWRNQDLRSDANKKAPVDIFALSETPCPRCLPLAQQGLIRAETVQRMPINPATACNAHDRSGKCCRDCGAADGLSNRVQTMTFEMARVAVGNERQEKYRLPGVKMGVTAIVTKPGDLDDQHAWLNRMNWFDIDTGIL